MSNYKSLTSKTYKKGMKWLLIPENAIDTFTTEPLNNTFTEGEVLAEETFDTVNIGGSSVTLPCSITSAVDVTNRSHNTYEGWGGRLCKAVVFMKKARITHTFQLEDPAQGMPTVLITLSGKTTKTARASNGWGDYKDYDASSNDVANWIVANKEDDPVDWVGNSEFKTYNDQFIDVIPWHNKKYSNDIYITHWNGQPQSGLLWTQDNPNLSDWNAYNQTGNVVISPEHYYENIDYNSDQAAAIFDNRYQYVKTVTKLNGRTFTIEVEFPIMFIYTAAARMGSPSAGDHRPLIDGIGFIDQVTSVNIQLIGSKVDNTSVTRSYSLDSEGEITTDIKNKLPYSLDKNELITIGSKYGVNDWVESMSKYVLTEYKNGKYVIEADVPAYWMLINNIQINTPLKVKDIFNRYITRDDRICLFEVKTIEKKFQDNEFYYSIKALESSTSTIDIGGIGLVYNINRVDDNLQPYTTDYMYLDPDDLTLKEGSENDVKSSKVLGDGIALTSLNTLVGDFIVVPGHNIGNKVVAIIKTAKDTQHTESSLLQIGFYESTHNTYMFMQDPYVITNNQKNATYYVAIINLTYKENLRFFTKNAIWSVVNSVQLYNAGNTNMTPQEAYEWLKDNNKLI